MDFLWTAVEWIFFKSIIGGVIVAAVVYIIFLALSRKFPKLPNAAVFAGLTWVIAGLTLPSIPRYLFEQKVNADLAATPWLRVIGKAYGGELTEPLTLIWPPANFYKIAQLDLSSPKAFRETIVKYGEDQDQTIFEIDCDASTVWGATPDSAGVFRSTTPKEVAITPDQRKAYCSDNWAPERAAMLKQMKAKSP